VADTEITDDVAKAPAPLWDEPEADAAAPRGFELHRHVDWKNPPFEHEPPVEVGPYAEHAYQRRLNDLASSDITEPFFHRGQTLTPDEHDHMASEARFWAAQPDHLTGPAHGAYLLALASRLEEFGAKAVDLKDDTPAPWEHSNAAEPVQSGPASQPSAEATERRAVARPRSRDEYTADFSLRRARRAAGEAIRSLLGQDSPSDKPSTKPSGASVAEQWARSPAVAEQLADRPGEAGPRELNETQQAVRQSSEQFLEGSSRLAVWLQEAEARANAAADSPDNLGVLGHLRRRPRGGVLGEEPGGFLVEKPSGAKSGEGGRGVTDSNEILLNKQRIVDALELAHSVGALRDRHVDAIMRVLETPETIEELYLTLTREGAEWATHQKFRGPRSADWIA